MMKLLTTKISGCYEIQPKIIKDERGLFIKTFHEDFFHDNGFASHFAEEYYSYSYQRVLRGLHFQIPPSDHVKMVYCLSGEVLDVVVDLRVGSPTFGQHLMLTLSAEKANMVYIPSGLAHGFYVTSHHAVLLYKVTSVYSPDCDTGILWSSVGIQWPDNQPIVSRRDCLFSTFDQFVSPFIYQG